MTTLNEYLLPVLSVCFLSDIYTCLLVLGTVTFTITAELYLEFFPLVAVYVRIQRSKRYSNERLERKWILIILYVRIQHARYLPKIIYNHTLLLIRSILW